MNATARPLFRLAAAGVALLACAWANAAGNSVEVFSLATMPITGAGNATVYYVDGISQIEQFLSQGLPKDPAQAQAIVQQRIQKLGPQLNEQSRAAAAGLARAHQLGIQRAPAIVFDGQWVVYGVTDVEQARRIHAARRPR